MRISFVITIATLIFFNCSNYKEKKSGTTKYINLANMYYENDNYEKAKTYYKKVYNKDTLNSSICYKLGVCYGKIYEFEKSNRFYQKAIDLDYRKGDAYYNIGINLTCQFKDSIALQYFKNALVEIPKDTDIINEINNCEERLGNKVIQL